MEDHTPEARDNARQQRRTMSLPEGMLWNHLRQRPLGVKFRNHHPLGRLVVDFYCASRRLVIEVDGISHNMGENPEGDRRRDAWLRSQGYGVIRIPATDVLRDPAEVAGSLALLCAAKPPPSAALRAPATSPRGGDSSLPVPDSPPLGEVAARSADGGGPFGVTA